MRWRLLNQSPWQQCDGLQTDPIDLWMPTKMDSMAGKRHGLHENIVAIESYRPASWMSSRMLSMYNHMIDHMTDD